MGKPTTTLEWTEHDGTPGMLPENGKNVLIFFGLPNEPCYLVNHEAADYEAVKTSCVMDKSDCDLLAEGIEDSCRGCGRGMDRIEEYLNKGDRWAYLPESLD
jgi:hypothetical protein